MLDLTLLEYSSQAAPNFLKRLVKEDLGERVDWPPVGVVGLDTAEDEHEAGDEGQVVRSEEPEAQAWRW